MDVQTHLGVDQTLVGEVIDCTPGGATARLSTHLQMAVDAHGLVHGGFVFGLADFAAMVAVNDPHVVLGAADTRFLVPVRVGDVVVATARVVGENGKKRVVECVARVGDVEVFTGTFTTFVLDKHVLER